MNNFISKANPPQYYEALDHFDMRSPSLGTYYGTIPQIMWYIKDKNLASGYYVTVEHIASIDVQNVEVPDTYNVYCENNRMKEQDDGPALKEKLRKSAIEKLTHKEAKLLGLID